MQLLPDWYIARHKNLALSDKQKSVLDGAFETLLANNLAQPKVYVHRDYHSRNLMVGEPGAPGILDFQDAVEGPITYDLVSLLRDAYIEWEEEQVIDWCVRYWEVARKVGLPVNAEFSEFYRDFEWMGLQRHLKVLGIFARLNYRDGKANYLNDIPLVMKYTRRACERYDVFTPLLRLLDSIEKIEVKAGYTF
jgi:aminoglycoside/choline kinase family phosphotransferase